MEKYFLISAAIIAGIGAVTDVRTRRIPNWLTYTGVAMAVSAKVVLLGWSGLADASAGVLVAGGIFCILFLLDGMGGGDVKLMAAVGAWSGSEYAVPILIATAVSGGFLALAYILGATTLNLASDGRLVRCAGTPRCLDRKAAQWRSVRLPYGIAISISTACCAGNAFLRR
jgi:prepilin peptidase CpaA